MGSGADQVLLVEDSKSLAALVKRKIESELGLTVRWLKNLAETVRCIVDEGGSFPLAILDVNLPDAPAGEAIDFVLSRNIPAIIFAGKFSNELREAAWSKMVVDYIIKENPQNIDYLVALVRRIFRNDGVKVLVVEDAQIVREQICDLLRVHRYQALSAPDGRQAMIVLEENPDIKLVIIDYLMPDMDGLQLTRQIRTQYRKEDLAIIGLSASGNHLLSAKFIKSGANDFLSKPFLVEEFHCRITHNIEMLEYIEQVREHSNRDYLTGIFNRRYFFELGKKLFASMARGHISLTIAVLDIDYFKKINDTHGHDAGDSVLRQLAEMLQRRFRETDIVCRYGGEEFCVLATNMAHDHAWAVFDELRRKIAATVFPVSGADIALTVSIGICRHPMSSLEEMISKADERLLQAKRQGRNQVNLEEELGEQSQLPEPLPQKMDRRGRGVEIT